MNNGLMHSSAKVRGATSTQSVHVMFVSGSLAGGGAERFVSTMLEHLDRQHFSLSLCLLNHNIKYHVPDDVRVFDLSHKSALHIFRTRKRLQRIVQNQAPDVILSNLDATGQYVGEALSDGRRNPAWIARTSNSPDQTFRGVKGKLRRLRLNRVYPAADFFVANSRGVAKRFVESFPFSQTRMQVIGNPVNVEKLNLLAKSSRSGAPQQECPVLFWMGRLCQQKRLDVLIDAFRQIRSVRNVRLQICGSKGPIEPALKDRIAELGLKDSVTLLPFQENPFPLVSRSDIALSTSDFEGLSNAVLEAQALGVPVVATRCEFGNEEIVSHYSSGILTERGDANAIAEATIHLLDRPELRAAMGRAARERIRQMYDVSQTMPPWEDLIRKAVELAKRRNTSQRQLANPTQLASNSVLRCQRLRHSAGRSL